MPVLSYDERDYAVPTPTRKELLSSYDELLGRTATALGDLKPDPKGSSERRELLLLSCAASL